MTFSMMWHDIHRAIADSSDENMAGSRVICIVSFLALFLRGCDEFGRSCGIFGIWIINCTTRVMLDAFLICGIIAISPF